MKWKDFYNYYLGYFLIVALVLGAMAAFVIYPAFNKILSIKKEISQEKEELEKKLSLGLNAKKTKEELDAISDSISQLDDLLIKKGDELVILGKIESLAAKNKIIVNSLKPDFNEQAVGSGIYKISLTINASGNFNQILSFLNQLDAADFYLVTDQLTISQAGNNTVSLALNSWLYFKNN